MRVYPANSAYQRYSPSVIIIKIFMTSLSDQDRKAYENYILASTDEERAEAIKKLIPGSQLYYHLFFIDRFKKVGSKLTSDDKAIFAQFKAKYPSLQEFKEIETRLKLLEYDEAAEAGDEEKKQRLLTELAGRECLNLYFDYQKPEDLHRNADSVSVSSHGEDVEDKEDSFEEPGSDVDTPTHGLNVVPQMRSRVRAPQMNRSYDMECDEMEYYPEQEMMEQVQMNNDLDMDDFQQNVDISVPRPRGARREGPGKKSSEFNYEKYFSKAKIQRYFKAQKTDEYDSTRKLQLLPKSFEHTIDFTNYHHNSVYYWAIQSKNKLADLQNQTFYDSLKVYFEAEYERNKLFELDASLCEALTIEQLDKLGALHQKIKEDKNFIGSYFQKHFNEELSKENQEVWSFDEKRANLLILYNYAKSHNMPKSLQSTMLIEILELGIKLGIYDDDLFREYLKMPLAQQSNLFKDKKKEANVDTRWNRYIGNVQQNAAATSGNYDSSQKELINKYLEYFCQKNGTLESYKEEFENHFLKQIEERISIFNSDDMTNLNVDIKKYQTISNEVILRFLESNKEVFKVEEEVDLALELKNIQTLYIKIFEFNTETYYKKTLQPFNTGVNLDGLVASTEKSQDYNYPSNKKHIQNFKFPELNGKVGLFIVEFIGNGMSSRAIIKKGSLSLIHKPTIAGHLAYVLDENKKICNGPKTGIQFDGQYYPADQEKGGKIFIPYGKSNLVAKAILINGEFAQLSDFERQTESYSFSAWIHINQESILIGTKSSLIIKPSLLINQRQASFEVLKNTKVTLTTQSYIDNIPVTKTFENIKFKNNRELILDFQVPPYLSSIQVNIETEVFNVTQQTTNKFSASKTFTIQTGQHSKNMNELYFRKEGNDYYLYLLGKNGEPRPKVNVNVKFIHIQIFNQSESMNVPLITDKDGRIKLGPLKKIMGIHCDCNLFGIHERVWMLNQARENFTYPNSVDSVENEVIEFPVLFKNKTRKNISLIRKNGEVVLEDMFDKIEFIKQDNHDFNKIKFTNLQDGTYILNIKKAFKRISITIHKGQYWENDAFILKRNCLFENRAALKMIKIANVKVEENKQATSDVSIKLEDFSQYTRVHVYANLFEETFNPQVLTFNQSKTVFPFAMWKNIFLSNRELSDEFRYVFDRKYAERFQGNTLERPRLVLKRQFVQTTTINQEVLRTGTEYQQHQVQEQQRAQFVSQSIAPRAYNQRNAAPQSYMMQNVAQVSYNVGDRAYDEFRGGYGGRGGMDEIDAMFEQMQNFDDGMMGQMKIPEFQNFLKNPPFSLFNLVPNTDGIVTFSANLAAYSQLYIVAVDMSSVAQRQVNLVANPIQKRDLSLTAPLDSTKGFTESRITVNIEKHGSYFIDDITSTEIQLIDDMKKVKGVLEELMKNNYYINQPGQVFGDLSSLVMKWHKLEQEEKNKQYNKHQCHELNVYIYFKDQKYFQEIVKPYLSCKMEKTFIDNYLLGNYDSLLVHTSLEKLQQLNTLEQCFLIDALIKKERPEQAKQIADYIEMKRDIAEPNDINGYNKTFDIVLNLNMLKVNAGQDDFVGGPGMPLGSATTATSTLHAQNNPFYMSSGAGTYAVFGSAGMGGGFDQMDAFSLPSAPPMMAAMQMQAQNQLFSNFANMNQAAPMMDLLAYDNFQNQTESLNMIKPSAYAKTAYNAYSHDPFGGDEYGARAEQKKKVRLQFEEIDKTNEYVETHYFKQTSYSTSLALVQVNSFWADYARFLTTQTVDSSLTENVNTRSFLSANFVKNASNGISSLLTFALLDLPFEAETHGYKTNEGRGVEIKASDNIILFKKEVREAPLDLTNDILVTHRYVEADSSNTNSAAMPEEFLVNKAYACEVIMTNVSPQQKEFSILYQIPKGSLPLEMTKYMKSIPYTLSPYTTQKMIFYFYFPSEGQFIHFPSNASYEQKITARAATNTLNVVKTLSVSKKETFRDILQTGSKDDIIDFLKKHNLLKSEKGFNFGDLLWMLKDKTFFKRVIQVLRERYIYQSQIWMFSLYHKDDEQTIREYFMNDKPNQLNQYLGTFFNSRLFSVTTESKEFRHLDYYPIINARVHLVGEVEQWTLNQNFKNTYERFLKAMIELKQLDNQYKMIFVYNLQLQDRINDAIALFKTIEVPKEGDPMRIQHDYMSAYFDFFIGQADGFKTARTIVRKYEDYPIPSWRILFLEILDQLNEYDGEQEEAVEIDPENLTEEQKKQKYKQSIKKEPKLDVEIQQEQKKIQFEVANIKNLSLKFYIIDAEILFSRTPFLKTNTAEFSYVKPCHVIEKELNNQDLNSSIDTVTYLQQPQKFELEIPEQLKNQNMVIEINGDNKQYFHTYYSTQIKVNVIEAYGELKVTDKDGNPLPKVYVKVFSQKRGQSESQANFFKDGYTDIRGKFEYAQTSSNKLRDVQKLAILVMSDNLGSIIKECNPPKVDSQAEASLQSGECMNQQRADRIINKVAKSKAMVYSKMK